MCVVDAMEVECLYGVLRNFTYAGERSGDPCKRAREGYGSTEQRKIGLRHASITALVLFLLCSVTLVHVL